VALLLQLQLLRQISKQAALLLQQTLPMLMLLQKMSSSSSISKMSSCQQSSLQLLQKLMRLQVCRLHMHICLQGLLQMLMLAQPRAEKQQLLLMMMQRRSK
jgi:hypothetical protein